MRKVLVMLICCGMFQLFASRTGEGGSNFLDPDLYTKTQKKSGGYLITYNEDFYDLQTQEVLEADAEGYFRTAYEYIMDGETKLFLSSAVTELVCVDTKPSSGEELLNCVWQASRDETRYQVNHRYLGNEAGSFTFGGCRISQFQLKDGAFRMYRNGYRLRFFDFVGVREGREEVVYTEVADKFFDQSSTEVNIKKGGKPWMSNPTGQGSSGEEPKSEVELLNRFKSLFPEYSSLL